MTHTIAPRRVLVVDDNHDAADTITEFLQMYGHHVLPSYDGADAVRMAAQFQPQVILCDLGMPGMDGYQVATTIRDMVALKDTKVIALTAWGDAAARSKAAAAGFHQHLVKPAGFAEILDAIA